MTDRQQTKRRARLHLAADFLGCLALVVMFLTAFIGTP